jgi:hypothetical protein
MAARFRPAILPPHGLAQAEAEALSVPLQAPRPLAAALAAILLRLTTEETSPLPESDATLSVEPAFESIP